MKKLLLVLKQVRTKVLSYEFPFVKSLLHVIFSIIQLKIDVNLQQLQSQQTFLFRFFNINFSILQLLQTFLFLCVLQQQNLLNICLLFLQHPVLLLLLNRALSQESFLVQLTFTSHTNCCFQQLRLISHVDALQLQV